MREGSVFIHVDASGAITPEDFKLLIDLIKLGTLPTRATGLSATSALYRDHTDAMICSLIHATSYDTITRVAADMMPVLQARRAAGEPETDSCGNAVF